MGVRKRLGTALTAISVPHRLDAEVALGPQGHGLIVDAELVSDQEADAARWCIEVVPALEPGSSSSGIREAAKPDTFCQGRLQVKRLLLAGTKYRVLEVS